MLGFAIKIAVFSTVVMPQPISAPLHQEMRRRRAFTIIELLVVVAITAFLAAAITAAASSLRRQARCVQCDSNLRQLSATLILYANQNRGWFPPNSSESGLFWYQSQMIGQFVSAPTTVNRAGFIPHGTRSTDLASGVFVCPNDREDSIRSYSLNLYASSGSSSATLGALSRRGMSAQGFRLGAAHSSTLMLLTESWSELPIGNSYPTTYAAQAIIGLYGTAGERFGGGRGTYWDEPEDATPGRFGFRSSQIDFSRHRAYSFRTTAPELPRGTASFAFLDGHAASLNQSALCTFKGISTNEVRWTPYD